jgi:outer membrane protein OmpA-like peptidoglycan-associated protein
MNVISARLFSSHCVAATVAVFALFGAFVLPVQAQRTPASAYADFELSGSVTEPQGEEYVAPQKLNPRLARITLYRPAHGFAPGAAHLEINGHYLTSLQLGGCTEVCVEPAELQLSARMVQTGSELKNFQDATAKLKSQAAQNFYVRVFEYGDGRATLTPVKADIAQSELKDTRLQIHAVSRLAQAKPCVDSVPHSAAATAMVKTESIVLGSDTLFAFGKADIKDIVPQGRTAMDTLIARLQKEYGNDEDALIQITGHADPLGNPASNKRLSETRALAIRKYMIEGGMKPERVTGQGVGAEQPVITTCGKSVTPETIECNKPNRRVVVSIEVKAR